jgi:hypothetical protein
MASDDRCQALDTRFDIGRHVQDEWNCGAQRGPECPVRSRRHDNRRLFDIHCFSNATLAPAIKLDDQLAVPFIDLCEQKKPGRLAEPFNGRRRWSRKSK